MRHYPGNDAGNVLESELSAPPYSVLLQLGFTKPESHPPAGELLPHRFTLAATIPPKDNKSI